MIQVRRFHRSGQRLQARSVFFMGAGEVAHEAADRVLGDLVDVVPPGSADDHLLVHRQRREILERLRSLPVAEGDRGVALLAGSAPRADLEDRGAPRGGVREGARREDLLRDLPPDRRRHAVIRHVGLHVSLAFPGLSRGRRRSELFLRVARRLTLAPR